MRRLLVVLTLLSPSLGLAQTVGEVLVLPAAFGVPDCTSTSTYVTLTWTSALTVITGDQYRVYVSTSSSCPTTGAPTGTKLGNDIPALTQTQGYGGGLSRSEFITASAASCTPGGPTSTIWVCVQHVTLADVVRTTMSGSAPLYVSPPPVPVSVTVAPGDSALIIGWSDGVANGVAAATYNVTVVAQGNAADTRTQAFTGRTGNRVTGLTNGVTYDVTVTAVSAGSTESAPSSPAVSGTPETVFGFWEQYQAASGREQGGCGGGPAGALSLLGLALALGGLRRRS